MVAMVVPADFQVELTTSQSPLDQIRAVAAAANVGNETLTAILQACFDWIGQRAGSGNAAADAEIYYAAETRWDHADGSEHHLVDLYDANDEHSIVARCETFEEAEQLASALNRLTALEATLRLPMIEPR